MNKLDLIIDALELCTWHDQQGYLTVQKALAAARELKAELAKPVNEFNPDWDQQAVLIERIRELEAELALDKKADNARKLGLDYEPEQEPVAWNVDGELYWIDEIDGEELNAIPLYATPQKYCPTPLYTSPPRKEWVGLTENEIDEIRKDIFEKFNKALKRGGNVTNENNYSAFNFYKKIEIKLRELNER